MSEKTSDLAVADSGGVQGQIVQPLVAMLKPAASFYDHGWRAIAMCGTRWMVAARYEDAVTVEDGIVTKTWDAETHAKLFAAAPALLADQVAVTAVHTTHQCPSCGVLWSLGECSEMHATRKASCMCGYRHPLYSSAAIAKATGAQP